MQQILARDMKHTFSASRVTGGNVVFPDQLVIDENAQMVVELLTSNISSEQKRELLGITTMNVNISGHRSPMMLAIRTTAQSVQKCFSGEARKIIYPDW